MDRNYYIGNTINIDVNSFLNIEIITILRWGDFRFQAFFTQGDPCPTDMTTTLISQGQARLF